jgi:hypothetical protein
MLGCLRSPLSALVFSVLLPVLAGAQGGTWHLIPSGENPFFPDSVPRFQRKYASDTSGNVFAASYDRMFRFAGGVVEDITPDLPPGRVIHGLVADPAGIPWIAVGYREPWMNTETRAGWSLHRRVGGSWATVPHAACAAGESLSPLGIDSAGRLILAAWKQGLMFPAPSVQALFRMGPAGCVEIPIPQRTEGTLQAQGYTRGPDGAEYLHGFLVAGDILVAGFLWELRSGSVRLLKDTIQTIRSLIAMPGRVLAVTNAGLATFQEGRTRHIDTIQGKPFEDVDDLSGFARRDLGAPFLLGRDRPQHTHPAHRRPGHDLPRDSPGPWQLPLGNGRRRGWQCLVPRAGRKSAHPFPDR